MDEGSAGTPSYGVLTMITQDICYVRATYIEFTMTIFGQCHNVLNNNSSYTVI